MTLFVCNDLLFVAEPKKETWKFKELTYYKKIEAKELPDGIINFYSAASNRVIHEIQVSQEEQSAILEIFRKLKSELQQLDEERIQKARDKSEETKRFFTQKYKKTGIDEDLDDSFVSISLKDETSEYSERPDDDFSQDDSSISSVRSSNSKKSKDSLPSLTSGFSSVRVTPTQYLDEKSDNHKPPIDRDKKRAESVASIPASMIPLDKKRAESVASIPASVIPLDKMRTDSAATIPVAATMTREDSKNAVAVSASEPDPKLRKWAQMRARPSVSNIS